MKRVAEQYLKKWINYEKRKPLVIRGARQVGKTTLVRQSRVCRISFVAGMCGKDARRKEGADIVVDFTCIINYFD